jgi:hypothetical protein
MPDFLNGCLYTAGSTAKRHQKKPHRVNDGVNLFENRTNQRTSHSPAKIDQDFSTELRYEVCSLITVKLQISTHFAESSASLGQKRCDCGKNSRQTIKTSKN